MSGRVIAGFLSLFLLVLSSAADADTLLQMKFKKGETQRLKMSQKQTMSMALTGQPQENTTQTQTMNVEVICDDVADTGIATLRHRLPRAQVSIQLPPPFNKELEYDTDEPAPTDLYLQEIDKILRPITSVDFSMRCNAQGKISDFVIPPKARNDNQSLPFGLFGGDIYSGSAIKQMAEQWGVSLPEKAVKPGDKWRSKTEFKSSIGFVKMDREHTYFGPDLKTNFEKIGIAVKVALQPVRDPMALTKVELKSGAGEGEILFDNKSGRVRHSQIKMKVEMETTAGTKSSREKFIFDMLLEDDAPVK